MLLAEWLGLDIFALNKATGLQEVIKLFGDGSHTGGTHAIAGQDLSLGLLGGEVFRARLQTAAAKGAEWHNLLTTQVRLVEEGRDGRRKGAEPHGITDENHVVGRNVGGQRFNLGRDSLLALFHATVNRGLEVAVIGLYRDNLLNVGIQACGDFLRHAARVRRLGVIQHQHLGCFFLRGARDRDHRGGSKTQHHAHNLHISSCLEFM